MSLKIFILSLLVFLYVFPAGAEDSLVTLAVSKHTMCEPIWMCAVTIIDN